MGNMDYTNPANAQDTDDDKPVVAAESGGVWK